MQIVREASGQKNLRGSVNMLYPCANTRDFNLCIVSHFHSSWSTSDHSSTILIQQMVNRWLKGRKTPQSLRKILCLAHVCFFPSGQAAYTDIFQYLQWQYHFLLCEWSWMQPLCSCQMFRLFSGSSPITVFDWKS